MQQIHSKARKDPNLQQNPFWDFVKNFMPQN